MSTGSKFHHTNESDYVVRTIAALRAKVDSWHLDGKTIGLTPTMGSIHNGHISLVTKSVSIADRTVASIFVNPKQFAAHEDLDTYPRDEAHDIAAMMDAGCDLIYCPSGNEMYPQGFETEITVPHSAENLCGFSRPHFFGGVATVVCKLLNQCTPDFAIFGEKDFQQLLIIQKMVRDLNMQVKIVGAPIVRETDGLAMSSRNKYLSEEHRAIAGKLNGHLRSFANRLKDHAFSIEDIETLKAKLLADGFEEIDYLDIRSGINLNSLEPSLIPANSHARIFAAVLLGGTRLIDNIAI